VTGGAKGIGHAAVEAFNIIRADEVASLVLFLCSNQAGVITGGSYAIDGGVMARFPVGVGG
jgi:NAD(P)-dependent dehydrogenase (short-subunit alcohol dehydrogenase family)